MVMKLLFLFLSVHMNILFTPAPFVSEQNHQANNRTKVGVSAINTIDSNVDSIKLTLSSLPDYMDTLNGEVSQIRQHVEAVSHHTQDYLEESREDSKWNKTNYEEEKRLTWLGLALSFFNIVAVVFVFIRTQQKTKEQIKNQHDDTIQIIDKMQEHSEERIDSIQRLGKQIQTSTEEIKKSVVHLERKFVTERDKAKITAPYSSVITDFEALSKDLENEYDHFNTNPKDSNIHQRASKIKDNIRKISQILSSYSTDYDIPNAKAYMDSIDKVVDNPSLENKREQINNFKKEGKNYIDQLNNCIQNVFNKK